MKIKISKKGNRNQLSCQRKDGGWEIADLGPSLPFHDLAHFITEQKLQLTKGFYGNIYQGFTVAQLSDKGVIKTLPHEAMVAEIVTRALQSLYSGACRLDQFREMVSEEFRAQNISYRLAFSEKEIEEMLLQYQTLINQWEQLSEGDTLEIDLQWN